MFRRNRLIYGTLGLCILALASGRDDDMAVPLVLLTGLFYGLLLWYSLGTRPGKIRSIVGVSILMVVAYCVAMFAAVAIGLLGWTGSLFPGLLGGLATMAVLSAVWLVRLHRQDQFVVVAFIVPSGIWLAWYT